MLTPHCSAASGMVVPPSIVPTTRLRRSSEYGFVMPAGLLPADILNHVRAPMGIPESAFYGNALEFRFLSKPRSYSCDRSAHGRVISYRLNALRRCNGASAN